MPESDVHQTIKKALFIWGQSHSNKYKPYYGDNDPLDIRHKTIRTPIVYRPDVYLKYKKRNGYIIIEVLYSQNKDSNLTWADAILSYLVKDVKRVFFVTTAIEDKLEDIENGVLNILRILSSMKIPNVDFLPNDVRVYPISLEEESNEANIMKQINQYAKEDKW